MEFTLPRDSTASSKETTSSASSTARRDDEEVPITVQSGLHCGPAGRRTLIKWIEDNYKLRKRTQHANPGVLACRLWQESQGFSDPVSKAIVDLLKLNGVPSNVTYKEVFENHLSNLLSTLIKKSADDKERLLSLAEKMIAMFQVTEVQPLLSEVLDHIEDIPEFAMSKLLDKTSSAAHFFSIATMNVKRKIFAAAPKKLYETVAPLIDDALFLLDLGILEQNMKNNVLYSGYIKEYQSIIERIVDLIGPPKTETSRTIYFLVQQCIRVIFTRSVLMANCGRTTNETNKDIDYDVCFGNLSFQTLKMTLKDEEDVIDSYRSYAAMSICILYDLDKNADETVKSVNEMRYSGHGFWNLSAIRHSIATTYQEKHRVAVQEMQLLEPFMNLIQLVSSTIDSHSNHLPADLLYKISKPKKDHKAPLFRIKDDMELFDVAFILAHPVMINTILSHLLTHLKSSNMVIIASPHSVSDWMPLLALGLSSHCIAAYKFLMEADLYFQGDDCFCKSFLKKSNSTGKPVSISKLLSYVYPEDKNVRTIDKELPPFLANILMSKLANKDASKADARTTDGKDITFHELLVLYLPRVNIYQLKAFSANCTAFFTSINVPSYDAVDSKECTTLLGSILDALNESSCNTKEYIKQMDMALEKYSAKDAHRYNIQILEMVNNKFKFLNSTVLGVLETASNITKTLMKMMAVKIVAECVTSKVARPVVKPALYDKMKRINVLYLREPTDSVWISLARIGFCEMNLVEFNSLTEVIANFTKQGHLCAFLPLYALASRRGDPKTINKRVDELQRVGGMLFVEPRHAFRLKKYMEACEFIKNLYNKG